MALPAYEQAYVTELMLALLPGAARAQDNYIYERTRARWQTQMTAYVTASGALDSNLPTYERAYVLEQYNRLLVPALSEFNQYVLTRTPWYWQEEMKVQLFAFNDAGSVPEAVSWFNAVIAGGASVSPTRQKIIASFIRAEKACGAWPLTDDYFPLWGENTHQALLSLKQLKVSSVVGAASSLIPSYGWNFTGAAGNYLLTTFTPSLHCTQLTVNTQRVSAFMPSTLRGNGYAFGAASGSAAVQRIRPRSSGGNLGGQVGSSTVSFNVVLAPAGTDPGGRGLWTLQRTLQPLNGLRNGAIVGSSLPTTFTGTPAARPLVIGAWDSQGTISDFSDLPVSLCVIGAALTPTQSAATYNNVAIWSRLIGATP